MSEIATGLKRRLNRKSLGDLERRESRRKNAARAAAEKAERAAAEKHPQLCRKSFSSTGPCAAMCADCAAFKIPAPGSGWMRA